MASYKEVALSADLFDNLKKRMVGLICVQAYDANNDPYITVSATSTPTAGTKVIVIRTKTQSFPISKDVLGLPENVFTPHVMQICTEANYAGVTDNVADILGPVELLPVLGAVCKRGAKVEWHVTANGTVPSTAAIDAGTNLKATFDADIYWANLSST